MAIGTSFKQQCPSCEAMVPVRDAGMIGKKIECPKCKDRFIVESPEEKDDDAPKTNGKVKSNGKPNGKANGKASAAIKAGKPPEAKKPAKRFRDEDEAEDAEEAEAEDDEIEEVGDEEPPARGKGAAKKPVKQEVVEEEEEIEDLDDEELKKLTSKKKKSKDEDEDEGEGDAKKKKPGASKFTLGIALAVVGLVVLSAAAFFILRGKGSSGANQPVAGKGGGKNDEQDPAKNPDNKENPGKRPTEQPLADAGAELTNLLPSDTEHVAHVNFKALFEPSGHLHDAVFKTPGALDDEFLGKKLGFSILAVDDLIRSERYSAPAWSFTVVHLVRAVDMDALTEALGLKAEPAIKTLTYYQATASNPWFEQLARVTVGVPHALRILQKQEPRSLYVHVHNPQTLIFADQAPMLAFLNADKQFRYQSEKATPPAKPDPAKPDPAKPNPANPGGAQPAPAGGQPAPGGAQPAPGGVKPAPAGAQPSGGAQSSAEAQFSAEAQPAAEAQPSAGVKSGGDDNSVPLQSKESLQVAQAPAQAPAQPPAAGMQGGAGQPPVLAPPGGGQLPPGGGPAPVGAPPAGMQGGAGQSGSGQPPAGIPFGKSETYMTIKPALKNTLDRMEARAAEKDKVLFSSATDLEAARTSSTLPEHKGLTLWQPRQVWDVTQLLQDKKPRLLILGTGLLQKDTRFYQLRNELGCPGEADAKDIHRELADQACHDVVRFLDRLLAHKVELPKAAPPPSSGPDPKGNPLNPPVLPGGAPPIVAPPGGAPPVGAPPVGAPPVGAPPVGAPPAGAPPGGAAPVAAPAGQPAVGQPAGAPPVIAPPGGGNLPMPGGNPAGPFNPGGKPAEKKEGPPVSRIHLTINGSRVDFVIDLVLDAPAQTKAHGVASLMAMGLRSQMELAAALRNRHDLAKAGKSLGEGERDFLLSRGVLKGNFPPGAFHRPPGSLRLAREPAHRVSWMAGLLPYLGRETLFNKIKFEDSWRDPGNWAAGQTLVPEFLDPAYPASSFYTSRGDMPFDLAATHFVGIAGVGLDAADYPADDPAFIPKRGVLGYEKGATLEEIRQNRGLSNSILVVQVPHDGLAGPTPWIAGGGSTLRGVPEKNSIAPFVLSTDRNGKAIQHKGKRGTYALMTDGSVRFVDQNVSDEVFQAMCTVKGPFPLNFDLNKIENTPLVPPPQAPKGPVIERKESAPKEKADPPAPEKGAAVKKEVSQLPASYKKFAVPNGGFSVMLPGEPLALDKNPKASLYSVDDQDNKLLIMLGFEKLAAKLSQDEIAERLLPVKSKIAKAGPAKLAEHAGVDFEVEMPKMQKEIGRAFVVGDRLIWLKVRVLEEQPVPAIVPAIIQSLQIGQ